MHPMIQKTLLLLGAGLVLATQAVAADPYPDHPVRIIDGYSAGGGTDYVARYLASKMGADFGASVIVENRPGASGQIGMSYVAKSKPDGYTLMVIPNELWSVGPLLYKRLPYDVERELMPVATLADIPLVLTVSANVTAKTVPELIAYAKANPGKLTFGTAGAGTTHHLAAELFKSLAKVDMVHVPYKGTSLAVSDLLAGQIDMVFSPITAVLPHIKSGKLRALGVTTKKRVSALPDTPTIAEAGVTGYEGSVWVFLVAPKGTPNEVINKWVAQAKKVFSTEEARKLLAVQGVETLILTRDEIRQRNREDSARWKKVIDDAKISIE
jgi:tripartite-type tricarboxylate transporter receptor subunit TctC